MDNKGSGLVCKENSVPSEFRGDLSTETESEKTGTWFNRLASVQVNIESGSVVADEVAGGFEFKFRRVWIGVAVTGLLVKDKVMAD